MTFFTNANIQKIRKCLNGLGVIASIILIVSISLEIFKGDPFLKQTIYFDTQFWICIYFCVDFFIFWLLSDNKWRFFKRYFIVILLSIPYLSLIDDIHQHLTESQIYLIRLIPLIRGAAAFILLVLLIVRRNTTALFISYFILLFAIIYFMTLLFFVEERGLNPEVKHFSDSLWWGAMTVTTLGSVIQPVTVAGKVITTSLAAVGMTIFPIFTAFITTLVNRLSQKEDKGQKVKAVS